MFNEGGKLTGKALIARMQSFLAANDAYRPSLKVTSIQGSRVSAHVIRCMLLEQFLDVLDEEAIIAHIQNEHNIIALFLHEALEPGKPVKINARAESGVEIDLRIKGKRAEVKTTRDVDTSDVPDIIQHWFDEMVDSQGDKEAWWLVHFVQRGDGNAHIGKDCMYYLVAIEITTRNIDEKDEPSIISEAMALIQKAEKKVKKDDGILEGALLPVDNVVHADRLRKKLKAKEATLQEKDAAIQEKDAAIQEKDVALKEKDAALQEKDAALQEKDATIQEQAKEIADLKRRLSQR